MILLANPSQNQVVDMEIRVEQPDSRPSVYFVCVERETWEDFFEVNSPGTMEVSVGQAYNRSKEFWEWIAIEKAKDLDKNHRGQYLVNNVDWLKRFYVEWEGRQGMV